MRSVSNMKFFCILLFLVAGVFAEIYDMEEVPSRGIVGDSTEVGSSGNLGLFVEFGDDTEIVDELNGAIVGRRSIKQNGASTDKMWVRDGAFAAFDAIDDIQTMSYCYLCDGSTGGWFHTPTLFQNGESNLGQSDSNTGAQICDGTIHFNHWNTTGTSWFSEMSLDDATESGEYHIYDNFGVNEFDPESLGSVHGDPHIVGFDGSTFDFIGEIGPVYNFLSDRGISVNAILYEEPYTTEKATYVGTAAIIVGDQEVVVYKNRTAFVGGLPLKEGTSIVGEITVTYIKDIKVVVEAVSYRVEALFIIDDVMGGSKYINLGFSVKRPSTPHGVVGRSARVLLKLQDELEPFVEEDYEMGSLLATEYKYSQFAKPQQRGTLSIFDASSFIMAQATRV